MWSQIVDIFKENWFNIALIAAIVVLAILIARYIKLLSLMKYCRKLAKAYDADLKKSHPLFLKTILNFKKADVKMHFDDKELQVKFLRIKPKTAVRFVSENIIEKIRYKKAVVPSSNNKGLTPSYVVNYSQGSEVVEKRSKMKFNFSQQGEVLKLILFTADPSEIRVFDASRNNDKIIGDGELAYGYYVGGHNFLRRWLSRNNLI